MPFFTTPEQTRQATLDIGTNLGNVKKDQRDRRNLEEILSKAQNSDDPLVLQDTMGKILSSVSPERQQAAMQYIGILSNNLQEKKRRKAIKEAGIDPNLPPDLQKIQMAAKFKAPPRVAPETKLEKEVRQDFFNIIKQGGKARETFRMLEEMESLTDKLSGVSGTIKGISNKLPLIGSNEASEFEALGLAALEAPIHSLFGKGVLAREKFKALLHSFTPTALESVDTQRGKIKALRRFTLRDIEIGNQARKLFDKYGTNVPIDEIMNLQFEANDALEEIESEIEAFKDRGELKGGEEGVPSRDEDASTQIPSREAPQAPTPPKRPSPPSTDTPKITAPKAKESATEESKTFQNIRKRLEEEGKSPREIEAFFNSPLNEILQSSVRDVVKDFGEIAAPVGRGISKGIGSTVDFVNLLGSFGGLARDIKGHSKFLFGKEMDFQELAEAGFDFITGTKAKPEDFLDRYLETGTKTTTEFVSPLGLFKGGKALMPAAAMDGFLAGTALQTVKDNDLGMAAEFASLFLPAIARNSPKLYEKAAEIAKNPAILKEMGKDFVNYVKEIPEKVRELAKEVPEKVKAAPKAFREFVKEKGTKAAAEFTKRHLDIKPEQIRPKEPPPFGERKKILSEIFNNEKVNAIEASIGQQPEGKSIYQPIFEQIDKEHMRKYEEILTGKKNIEARKNIELFETPKGKEELEKMFWEDLGAKTKATKTQNQVDFLKMKKMRPKGDALTPREHNELINQIDEAIEMLKKGGTAPGDRQAILFLESVKDRFTKIPKESSKKVIELRKDISKSKSKFLANQEKHGKNVIEKTPELKKSIAEAKKELKTLEKSRNKFLESEKVRTANFPKERRKIIELEKDISKSKSDFLLNEKRYGKNIIEKTPELKKVQDGHKKVIAEAEKEIETLGKSRAEFEEAKKLNKEREKVITKSKKDIEALIKSKEELEEVEKAQRGYEKSIAKAEKEIGVLRKTTAEIEEVEEAYRAFNRSINWSKEFQTPDAVKIKVRNASKNALEKYGKRNEPYLNEFNKLNKRYADQKKTILSDMAFSFLHGEDPEMVKLWLNKPANVKKFDALIHSQGDLLFHDLGKTIKLSKVYDIITPKLFNEGKLRSVPLKMTIQEQRLVHSLLGEKSYNNLKRLQADFSANASKLEAYRNRSFSGVHVSMEAKKLAKMSAFWDTVQGGATLLTGHPIAAGKHLFSAGKKMAWTHQTTVQAQLFTNPEFQKVLLEVVQDSKKLNPSFKPLEKLVEIMKKQGIFIKEKGLSISSINEESNKKERERRQKEKEERKRFLKR